MMQSKTSPGPPNGNPGLLIGDQYVPYVTGVFPSDFPTRLAILKAATGLSWNGFAALIGVDPKQLRRWRKGAVPSGGVILALLEVAVLIPGGVDVLRGRYPARVEDSFREAA